MWITPDVELPDPLLDSLTAGNLVIFAGAGISVDAPASMPTFNDLIRQLGDEAGQRLPPWALDQPDTFLGDLEESKFAVHGRVASILNPGNTKTINEYHKSLVRLFSDSSHLRIVTTNHDPFLSYAVEEAYPGKVESFYAPALPVGDDFAGVVYLHGGIQRQPRRLVLTDGDFGRAYLTEGWATTFLRAMYSRFDVLFIGYRHGEPVLRYLARGLSSRRTRFAFDISDADTRPWEKLGITPILYPRAAKDAPFANLRATVLAWAERMRMGLLDHDSRIGEMVDGAPPIDPAQADYLRRMLKESATARLFAGRNAGPQWLDWIREIPEFQALFGRAPLVPASYELANWFAQSFVLEHTDAALSIVQELGGQLTPPLWMSCAQVLWTADARPVSEAFAKWVNVLIESVPAWEGPTYLGYLLTVCRWPEDRSTALMLFSHLTDPHAVLEQRLAVLGEERGIRVRVEVRGDDLSLRQAWSMYFKPHIDEIAEQLEPIVTAQLVRAHELLKSVGDATDQWDPMSFLRYRIEELEE